MSVLLPTFRRPEWLEESLLSLLCQTGVNIHLVLMDNGSQCDDTMSVMEHYLPMFYDHKFIRMACNSFDNIPIMDKHVIGDYVVRFTDDDRMLPGNLAMKCKVLESDPDIGICFSSAMAIDENGTSLNILKGTWTKPDISLEEAFVTSYMVMSGTVMRRDAFRIPFWGHAIGNEWGQHMTILDSGYSAHYIEEPLTELRLHPDSDTQKRGHDDHMFCDMHIEMWEKWAERVKPSLSTWEDCASIYYMALAAKHKGQFCGAYLDDMGRLLSLVAKQKKPGV